MQTVQTYTSVPAFAGSGSKVAPSGGAYSTGYLQGQRLPASHANYFWGNLTLNGVTEQGALTDIQTELVNALNKSGQGSLAGTGDSFQLIKTMIATSRNVGELVTSEIEQTPAIWASGSATYVPLIKRYDSDHDITPAQAPDLVTKYLAVNATINVAGALTSSWTATVSGSGTFTLTFANTPANVAFLNMYANEALANGYIATQNALFSAVFTGTAQRTVNVAGTNYAVTGCSVGGLTLTGTGSPTSGSQTILAPTYAIAGSGNIRLPRISGFLGVTTYDYDGNFVAGWRKMDQGQGHYHSSQMYTSGAAGTSPTYGGTASAYGPSPQVQVLSPSSDGTNGTPRNGKTNDPRAYGVYVYTFAGRLLA